ncbi:hypothetical protein FA95DRAFT_1555374 [Auriscalpium vulgare]|uniref:Uncharacterized protein n=1 Tax=Auriscalpium vulgare TaxID=40419 RepID=A0ACB8S3C7_9AGAM|nr:hypothetical protein FA95DRAFT_1555374 [Auriscalpium vulgare]
MGDTPPPQSSSPTLPSPPSETEAKFYYAGLPSAPALVARSSTTPWKVPTSLEEYYANIKELRPAYHPALNEVWDAGLGSKIGAALDAMDVQWTSLDIVRIVKSEEYTYRPPENRPPIILWIGVNPASLSGRDGVVAALKCRELLVESNITDVDVEIRESVVVRWGAFPTPTDPPAEPAAFALPSCTQSAHWAEGSGCLFIPDGWNTETLLVPARHVVFIADRDKNKIFERKKDSRRRYHVRLFADAGLKEYLTSIHAEIGGKYLKNSEREKLITELEGKVLKGAVKRRQRAEEELEKEKMAMRELRTFHENVSTHKTTPESRLLSEVTFAPPIRASLSYSGNVYTEDWAAIDLDASKVDLSNVDDDEGADIPADE